jgi:hypothetical protein
VVLGLQMTVADVHIMGVQHSAALAPKVATTLRAWVSTEQVPPHAEHVGAQHVACRTAGAPAAVVAAAAIGPVLRAQEIVASSHMMAAQQPSESGVVPAFCTWVSRSHAFAPHAGPCTLFPSHVDMQQFDCRN